ncbi:MAG: GGDEF domain-containing protein [Gammaproteobacteria bacterium]
MKRFRQAFPRDLREEMDQAELRGFARSVSEVEWLLLALVAIYLVAPGIEIPNRTLAVVAWGLFASLSLIFRFLPMFRRQTRLKIALQTLFMIAFTTAVVFAVGATSSHLLSLYLLPVIVSALTLGRWTTLLMVVLAAVGFVMASVLAAPSGTLTVGFVMELAVNLGPFLLIAMVTTMLAYEMEVARSRIRTLSETDELTGLYNVRAFSRVLKREHEKAVRHRRSYTVLMLDLDGLKTINDGYGHEVGNRAIILVANVITRLIRSTDAAARYGGDEFVVLLSETGAEDAGIVAKRIRQAVGRASIEVSGAMVKPSVSAGAASFPEDGDEPQELIVKADHAMYREKESLRMAAEAGSGARREAPG